MIVEYHRPDTLEQALSLLQRQAPRTIPLGGGTRVSQMRSDDLAVVDLQALGLDSSQQENGQFIIGTMARMKTLAEVEGLHPALKQIVTTEFPANMRQMATVGGEIVSCDGRVALVTALLAMDARLVWLPERNEISLGNYLPQRTADATLKLLVEIVFPANGQLLVEKVSRSPVDFPLLSVAVFRWPSGRIRVALGGYGDAPILALDGPDATGAELAAKDAYLAAGDEWCSAEYRSEVAARLVGEMTRSFAQG